MRMGHEETATVTTFVGRIRGHPALAGTSNYEKRWILR